MDYELMFWIGLAVVTLISLRVIYVIYGPSQTISDETLYRLCK